MCKPRRTTHGGAVSEGVYCLVLGVEFWECAGVNGNDTCAKRGNEKDGGWWGGNHWVGPDVVSRVGEIQGRRQDAENRAVKC